MYISVLSFRFLWFLNYIIQYVCSVEWELYSMVLSKCSHDRNMELTPTYVIICRSYIFKDIYIYPYTTYQTLYLLLIQNCNFYYILFVWSMLVIIAKYFMVLTTAHFEYDNFVLYNIIQFLIFCADIII